MLKKLNGGEQKVFNDKTIFSSHNSGSISDIHHNAGYLGYKWLEPH